MNKHRGLNDFWAIFLTICLAIASESSYGTGTSKTSSPTPSDIPTQVPVVEKSFKTGNSPNAVAWSPNGHLLAIGESFALVKIWDYDKQSLIQTIKISYFGSNAFAFTADGSHIITSVVSPPANAYNLSFSVIDVATGKVIRDVEGPVQEAVSVQTNTARNIVISTSEPVVSVLSKNYPPLGSVITTYDSKKWRRLNSLVSKTFLAALGFCQVSNDLLILHYNGELELMNPKDLTPRRTLQSQSNGGAIACSANGKMIATANGLATTMLPADPDPIRIWNAKTLNLISSAIQPAGQSYAARSISFSPDGKLLASLNYDGKARIWDSLTMRLVEVIDDGGKGGVSIAFSPDGRRLAIARDFEVNVIKVPTAH